MIKRDFTQCTVDPCLFTRKDCIVITYVDDCLIFYKDKGVLDDHIKSLEDEFRLTDEGDLETFLGVNFIHDDAETLEINQPHLIERILEALSLNDDAKMHDTPANNILHGDKDGKKRVQQWNYRSVVGMLSYLAATTRPDILFAVHQCARFCSSPMRSHEEAVKRIGRYLKRTRNKGIIFMFNVSKGIEVFVDADFAGSWFSFNSHEFTSALSRTGYIIKIANCPICWVSKMQTEVALSTTEAEYIALSQSTRDLLPIKNIIEYLNQFMSFSNKQISTYSTIFEDNAGALRLAVEPKYRPRTKHICVKYHHFRQYVKNKTITIKAISTNNQQADIFTKPLPLDKFKKFRYEIMGW